MEEVAASKRSLEHREDWKDVNLPTKTFSPVFPKARCLPPYLTGQGRLLKPFLLGDFTSSSFVKKYMYELPSRKVMG